MLANIVNMSDRGYCSCVSDGIVYVECGEETVYFHTDALVDPSALSMDSSF